MKKCGKLFIALLLCAALFAVLAAAVNADDDVTASGSCGADGSSVTWTLYRDGRLVISGNGDMENYYYDDDMPWYNYRDNITSVEITSGVRSIGEYAFYRCDNLASVKISSGLKSIGDLAFGYCTSLTRIYIPESVTTTDNSIFYECYNLSDVTMPAALLDCISFSDNTDLQTVGPVGGNYDIKLIGSSIIPDYAFSGNANLRSVTIPDSVKKIGQSAFADCYRIESLSIPYGVATIDGYAFDGCSGLQSVTIPTSLLNEGLFVDSNRLKTAGPFDDGKSYNIKLISSGYLPAYAFCGYGLTEVKIPDGITEIGKYAFSYCSELTSITIPKNVTVIGEYAFAYCDKLDSVTINASSLNISKTAFAESDNISSLVIPLDLLGSISFSECSKLMTAGPSSGNYNIKFSSSGSIPAHAFSDYYYLTSVTIPNDVVSIGAYAFSECGITSISIPASVTSIGDHAFFCCNIPSIKLPANLTRIGAYAFCGCEEINDITIPSKVTSIGSCAFADCYSLSNVKFSGSAPTIGAKAFCSVEATVFYPKGDSSWTSSVRQNYGGYLTWVTEPTIKTQPASTTVYEGKTASFKVVADGGDLSYQWYYCKPDTTKWTKVSVDGTSATYKLTTAARHNGYQYRCKVSNAAGSVYTNTVTLTVTTKPVITTHPKNLSVAAGKTATFKVAATGATSYQWYYRISEYDSWTAVKTNGKAATYTLTAATRHDGYQYRCKVTNAAGSVYSNAATLTIIAKPTITTQPTNKSVAAGKTATFKVVATGATSYQWYYRTSSSGDWTAVKTNGKAATYSLTAAKRHNGYQYRCKVSNAAGSVYSKVVTLAVASKPTITTQPVSVTVSAGKTATFKVAASGTGLSYQWYYRTSSSGEWMAVKTNGKAATYTLSAAARHNGYQYRCKVSNAAGSVYSSTVTLTLK